MNMQSIIFKSPFMYSLLFMFSIAGIMNSKLNAQTKAGSPVSGAWKASQDDTQHQLFFIDGYYFYTVHKGSLFQTSQGGTYTINGNLLKGKLLYNSADSSQVGQEHHVPFSIEGQKLLLDFPSGKAVFDRADDGNGQLAGVWRITGRMQDGKITSIHQTGSRQTYKLLTGTKFQWVAIDPAKKQFSGTGGGSYTFKDGKYTENIEFFSRDNSRVGAALVFDGKLQDGSWHHSGLSSKGAKIYEVWSKVP
jgi:hypothetical protein